MVVAASIASQRLFQRSRVDRARGEEPWFRSEKGVDRPADEMMSCCTNRGPLRGISCLSSSYCFGTSRFPQS